MTQYEKIAMAYSKPERMEHPYRKMLYARWIEECERRIGSLEGKGILDLGCGSGDSSRLLAKNGARVLGIDSEISMINIAKAIEAEVPLGIEYALGDAQSFSSHETFDLIAPTNLLHYAESKKKLFAMADRMHENLKSGGWVVGFNSDLKNPVSKYSYSNQPYFACWIGRPWTEGSRISISLNVPENPKFTNWWWSPETYEQSFRKAGFAHLEWKKPEFFSYETRPENWVDMEINSVLSILIAKKKGG